MSIAMTLANNLRTVMVDRGLCPDSLAAVCALEVEIVQSLLLGRETSTVAELDCLIQGLDVAPEDLLSADTAAQQRDVLHGRKQLEQYWSLPDDQRAQVDAFTRGAVSASRRRFKNDKGAARGSILSDAELRVAMKF